MQDQHIAAAIVALLRARRAELSICPSEAARALTPQGADWHALMPAVRAAAAALARAGVLRITRGTQQLSPAALDGGPIRLRRGPAWRD